jgi:hypothetical protein
MHEQRAVYSNQRSGDVGRKRFLLNAAVTVFVVFGLIFLFLPLPLPRPLRIGVAMIDFIAAAIIWLLGRQRYGK